MDKRFANLFNLTEEQAIAVLDTPQDLLSEDDSRYVAASHLANFDSEAAIAALIRAVSNTEASPENALDNRIARRKSVESLGKLRAAAALPAVRDCLAEEDIYTVEAAAWTIGEIGTEDAGILDALARVLERPGQMYRTVLRSLTKLDHKLALESIRQFVDSADAPTASAAATAVCRLTGDPALMPKVVAFLQSTNVNARRGCIEDLIDARYYPAIPQIARCPVSVTFRLRAIRLLAEAGIPAGSLTFEDVQPSLELALCDRPQDLDLVHRYDRLPEIPQVVRNLYHTDFGRCYLAAKTLLESYADEAPVALLATYEEEARTDYGAHYHVIKLLGWLRCESALELCLEALQDRTPQFQKSRAAAALALGELGDRTAIPALQASLETQIWSLKYAALLALEKLGEFDTCKQLTGDTDWLVRERAKRSPGAIETTGSEQNTTVTA